jgi:diguanylate cyclase (GGDEF)-like protein
MESSGPDLLVPEASAFYSELSNKTISLLEGPSLGIFDWREKVWELEERYGPDVYPNLLFLLTNLAFAPDSAKSHWEKVLLTWEVLDRAIEGQIDLRVAVLHYFLEVQKKLENPTIVEIRLLQRVQDSVVLDGLTQLYNYRYFRDRIEQEVKRALRYNQGLSLLMVDADDFKVFNDNNGHHRGNIALRQLAVIFKHAVREVDVVTRYGGEEFAIILPTTMKAGALIAAEKIREKVEETKIPGEARQPRNTLTVSIGVATIPTDATDTTDLIQQADGALYKAKKLGKNRVEACSPERRSFVRHAATLAGRIRLLDDRSLPFTTSNVSQGGLLIQTKEPLATGSVVQLELDFDDDQQTMACTGCVAWVDGDGTDYQLGVKIVQVDPAHFYYFKQYIASSPEIASE